MTEQQEKRIEALWGSPRMLSKSTIRSLVSIESKKLGLPILTKDEVWGFIFYCLCGWTKKQVESRGITWTPPNKLKRDFLTKEKDHGSN